MKFKLDECLDARLASSLRLAGYQADTVREQGMGAAGDRALFRHCVDSNPVLVTLDKSFSNVVLYPPAHTPGIVVLRGPDDLFQTTKILIETLLAALRAASPTGRLWIVEVERVRIHEGLAG